MSSIPLPSVLSRGAVRRGILVLAGLAALLLVVPLPARGQAEQDFFRLYRDWRVKQTADYNLDGVVNYWDALCLSYLWAGQQSHRFYMAGGGTGVPANVIRAAPGNTRGLGFNTVVARPNLDVVRADPGTRDSMSVAVAQPPIEVVRADVGGTRGLRVNVTVALPPVDLTRADPGGTRGLLANLLVARPPVEVVRADPGGTQGLGSNLSVAQPPIDWVRAAPGDTRGLASNLIIADPPVSVSREAGGKTRVVVGSVSDPTRVQEQDSNH